MAKKFVRKFNSKNPVPVSYVKSFDSFEDGYKEVITLNPEHNHVSATSAGDSGILLRCRCSNARHTGRKESYLFHN